MIEIFAFVYFIRKIRTIAEEKGIEAKAWIWKLVIRWLAIDIGVMVGVMYLFDISLEDETFLLASLPAIALALVSAVYTVKQMREEEDQLEEVEFEKQDENFDHFR